jgi:hypothetical protein
VRTLSLPIAFLAALSVIAFPARAQANDVPLQLKQTTECMLKVLRTVPGVSEPRIGNSTSDGWTHPYLEYRAAEDSHWEQPTRFDVQKSHDGRFRFMAVLPGVGGIDIHVTNNVVKEWKERCGVEAVVLLA